MLKILATKWSKNQHNLKKYFEHNYKQLNNFSYKDIVKITFEQIFNCDCEDVWDKLNLEKVIEIDHGDYQGTLIFVIPFNTYQPGPSQYLMTYLSYGSCSCCDTLQSLQAYYFDDDTYDEVVRKRKEQISGYMSLCKDILMNTIKPYNTGWRYDAGWDEIEWDGDF